MAVRRQILDLAVEEEASSSVEEPCTGFALMWTHSLSYQLHGIFYRVATLDSRCAEKAGATDRLTTSAAMAVESKNNDGTV